MARMHINVSSISPRDEFNKILVRVHFRGKKLDFSTFASVDVFIGHTDSYADIRAQAIEAAREFFREALATGAAETSE